MCTTREAVGGTKQIIKKKVTHNPPSRDKRLQHWGVFLLYLVAAYILHTAFNILFFLNLP